MVLYGKAVEYYSGMNDPKFKYFGDKIQNMMAKPEVMKVFKAAEPVLPIKEDVIDSSSQNAKGLDES